MRLPAITILATALSLSTASAQLPSMSMDGGLHSMGSSALSGSVRTTQGQPAADARVEIRNWQTAQIVGSGYTNKMGTFEISNLPRGRYEVVVTYGLAEGRERVEVGGSALSTVSIQIPVAQGDASAGNSHSVSARAMQVPKKARKVLEKATEALRERKLDKAKEYVAAALKIYPEYAEALTLNAVLLMDGNDPEAACGLLENALKADPSYGMAYFVLGAAYNALSKFDDAIRTLDRGVGLSPDGWQGYFELGKANIGKKHYQQAIRHLDKAQFMGPKDFPLVHLVKAHALLGLESYGEAMAELQTYLAQAPANDATAANAQKTLDQVKALLAKK